MSLRLNFSHFLSWSFSVLSLSLPPKLPCLSHPSALHLNLLSSLTTKMMFLKGGEEPPHERRHAVIRRHPTPTIHKYFITLKYLTSDFTFESIHFKQSTICRNSQNFTSALLTPPSNSLGRTGRGGKQRDYHQQQNITSYRGLHRNSTIRQLLTAWIL